VQSQIESTYVRGHEGLADGKVVGSPGNRPLAASTQGGNRAYEVRPATASLRLRRPSREKMLQGSKRPRKIASDSVGCAITWSSRDGEMGSPNRTLDALTTLTGIVPVTEKDRVGHRLAQQFQTSPDDSGDAGTIITQNVGRG